MLRLPVTDPDDRNPREEEESGAAVAVKLQKVYRSYRTRRRLADSAIFLEELWWRAIDFARQEHSMISFFDFQKPESTATRWSRVGLNASKVGKGLSQDAKAQKLAAQHWIEAIDPRHRYGHGLHMYFEEWCKVDSGQPFFYWLDVGDGKDLNLKDWPRSKLRSHCIKYLGLQERERYEYVIDSGMIIHKLSGGFLDTRKGCEGAKWIFVLSTSRRLYAGEKKKGDFHHSSFLAGGATIAAGKLAAARGILKSISAYSGHYRPTEDRLDAFLSFLKDNRVNLDGVKIHENTDDSNEDSKSSKSAVSSSVTGTSQPPAPKRPQQDEQPVLSLESADSMAAEANGCYKRRLSGGLQSPIAEVLKTGILQRINSKSTERSYQLGHQASSKWSTGAGPRIRCIADYPVELRQQAHEFVGLSPRNPPTPSFIRHGPAASPDYSS